jgi:hypothetical protein
MALSYKDEFEQAMPYLDAALAHRPHDYTLNHYAGINKKLRSDRLPETELTLKTKLWSEAITYCETARRNFPRQPGREPSWNDRFFFIHWYAATLVPLSSPLLSSALLSSPLLCSHLLSSALLAAGILCSISCEPYQALAMQSEKDACNEEALALGIWRTAGQRPGRYNPALRAQPWWKQEEMGRSVGHVELLQKNWKMIRKEARRVLKSGQREEGDGEEDRNATAVADASGFALEGAGLHAQRSWHECVFSYRPVYPAVPSSSCTCTCNQSAPSLASSTNAE